VTSIDAQTYLDNLQKQEQGKGIVTIHESKEINDLVNGKTPVNTNSNNTSTKTRTSADNERKQVNTNNAPQHTVTHTNTHIQQKEKVKETTSREPAKKAESENKKQEADNQKQETKNKTAENDDEEFDIPVIDMRKKVMRGSYKVTGYRIQAFAGGNSRNDREQAQDIGKSIKKEFPELPVYVHFYSPRWICRVGNFRDLSEAQNYLKKIREMGYKSACLVKGKITVQR
jgi:DNA mismatch repair ATPase MutL